MNISPPVGPGSLPAPEPLEARLYYAGLPSSPVLVGRSSIIPWEAPSGPEAYNRSKVLGVVGRHPIADLWEGILARKIIEHLNSQKVLWTSIDVVRISYAEESPCPVILWVGVQPESLSFPAGRQAALSCKDLLVRFGIFDVEVEIRQSLVTSLAGPELLAPTFTGDPTADIRNPLIPTLGLPIASKRIPFCEGTGGFFVAEGGDRERLFLITARHVLFQVSRYENNVYERNAHTTPDHEVILIGDARYTKFLKSIRDAIEGNETMINNYEKRVARLRNEVSGLAAKMRQLLERKLSLVIDGEDSLHNFHSEVLELWSSVERRVLGHVIYSPPVQFGHGPLEYTQDFAVIEVDRAKVNETNLPGNVIDLGTNIPPDVFTKMMYPNLNNSHIFEYPEDRLLRLAGTIPDLNMYHRNFGDSDDQHCLLVLKHGNGTGLTVGRANNLRSCVRNYYDTACSDFSRELAILPLDRESGPFSAHGDSGACVVDGSGRMGGIITGGAGLTHGTDITYVSSINQIMEGVKVKFPHAHLHPPVAT
ncbi:hypothetical protein HOY80DRAFT_927239 [Tuber brumale]|nr:hypothetical protein HOY80DRAFT_927239 [Tuber brumale]